MTEHGGRITLRDLCSNCGRTLIEEGARKRIEAAWDRDEEHPVVKFLDNLLAGRVPRARKDELADLAIRFEEYCRERTLSVPDQLNDLGDGIWEIKARKLRIPFYALASSITVRATHGFVKGTPKTPRNEIYRAQGIRREDRER